MRSNALNAYPDQPVGADAITSLEERNGGQLIDLESDIEDTIGDFLPAFSQMLIMKDQSIWLRKVTPEVTSQRRYHLSPDGVPLGLLSLEDGFSLRNAVPGHVYVSG